MIAYRLNQPLEAADVARVFESSGINRPTADLPRIERMLAHANLIVSAWDADRLIGVGRALTDYAYCCYLSDLAVDASYQNQGVGQEIVRQIRGAIGEDVSLILVSAPGATAYYPKLGFSPAAGAFIIRRKH
ncbi:MAG TPA: GNAT family N-acetyltransferase [Rhodocyclaceae bacterium]|nr:GNAT family N-acetyltransferase [Rhodocyclaceae bacterium]